MAAGCDEVDDVLFTSLLVTLSIWILDAALAWQQSVKSSSARINIFFIITLPYASYYRIRMVAGQTDICEKSKLAAGAQ